VVDFSIFQNTDNLIFAGIAVLFSVLCLFVLGFIIYKIFQTLFSIFSRMFAKDKDVKDLGEDLEISVQQLEESKLERQKLLEKQEKFGKTSISGPKLQYSQNKPAGNSQKVEEDVRQSFDKKEEKDIEESLGALKKSAKGEEEEKSTVFSKIKIPVAKKYSGGEIAGGSAGGVAGRAGVGDSATARASARVSVGAGGGGGGGAGSTKEMSEKGATPPTKGNDVEKASGPSYKPVSPGKDSILQQNRMEMLKGAEIKIPQERAGLEKASDVAKLDTEHKTISSEVHDKFMQQNKNSTNSQTDDSMFGGKSEVSRIDLRHKLRYDSKIWKAEKQVGLTLDRAERANLEKEVFSQTYGRDISKTDLKWGIKKLNQKMLGTKDLAEKGKIRKEIKFFKKIGGIK